MNLYDFHCGVLGLEGLSSIQFFQAILNKNEGVRRSIQMPQFCQYRNCHNLGSSTYMGYCNEYHFKRGLEDETLFRALEKNPQLSTLRDARLYVAAATEKRSDEKR